MADQKYEAFIKVAETGSFKKAAEELGYTQAGISYMITSLEKEFDTTLFVREYGGTRLSAEGENLLPYIQGICNSERQLAARLAELKQLEGGSVRVAAFTSTSIHWLPGIIKMFQEKHPAIELELVCSDDQDEVEDLVWNGDVDCGFFALPIVHELETVFLRDDPMLVVLPEGHPEASAPFFSKAAMQSYPYIRLKSGIYSEMEALLERHGATPDVAFTIDNDYAVLAMVGEGLGYSVFPELILRDVPFPVVCKKPEIPTSRELAIAVRSLTEASAATHAFIECTCAWVAQAYGCETSFCSDGLTLPSNRKAKGRSAAKTQRLERR